MAMVAMVVAATIGGETERQIRGTAEDEDKAATVTFCLSAEELPLTMPPLRLPCLICWTWTACFHPFPAACPGKIGAAPGARTSTMLA